MKTIIEEIRKFLVQGLYKDEQHIRLSLVSRIFLDLEWNIWNPSEYYTEYPAITLDANTPNILGNGKIDIAIGKKLNTKPEKLYALIEVKAIGKIDKEARKQLQGYSANKKPPLSILTDGVVWEFYLNTIPINSKSYTDCMFNSMNLESDDIDTLVMVLRNLLCPGKVNRVRLLARRMRDEFEYIQLIKKFKPKAQNQFPGDDIKQLKNVTTQIRKEIGNKPNLADKVGNYWKRTIALGGLDESPVVGGNGDGNGDEVIKNEYRKDYRFTDPRYVKIGKNERQVVDDWKHLMQVIYNYLIENHATDVLKSTFNLISKNQSDFSEPLELVRGYYAEKHLNNTAKVANCRKALKQAKLDPKEKLTIWYVEKKRK